jgi:hypothetical protein
VLRDVARRYTDAGLTVPLWSSPGLTASA